MKKKEILFLILVFLLWPNFAYAYLDLGSLTVFFQIIVAGIIGSLLTLKFWWKSFIDFVKKIFQAKKKLSTIDKDKNETKR